MSTPQRTKNPFLDPKLGPSGALVGAHVALARAIERHVIAEVGLDTYTADLLVRLMRSPTRSLRGVEIAQRLLITPSRTTRLIDRTEAAGLVVREPDPVDRRAQQIVLTDEGEQLALSFAPLLLGVLDEVIFETFTADELDTLVSLLDRLQDAATDVAAREEP